MGSVRRGKKRAKRLLTPAHPRTVSRQRIEYIERIERMRALNGASTPFVEQAQRMLLPRYWAKASWRARAETLATIAWLLRMAESAHESSCHISNDRGISSPRTAVAKRHAQHLLDAKP